RSSHGVPRGRRRCGCGCGCGGGGIQAWPPAAAVAAAALRGGADAAGEREIPAGAVPAVREGGLPPVDRHRRGLLLRHHPRRRLPPRIGRLRAPDDAATLAESWRREGRGS
ncbi:Os01g0622000, partial [Oryza sativa Japonica Group]